MPASQNSDTGEGDINTVGGFHGSQDPPSPTVREETPLGNGHSNVPDQLGQEEVLAQIGTGTEIAPHILHGEEDAPRAPAGKGESNPSNQGSKGEGGSRRQIDVARGEGHDTEMDELKDEEDRMAVAHAEEGVDAPEEDQRHEMKVDYPKPGPAPRSDSTA